jgi:hypothetical protein
VYACVTSAAPLRSLAVGSPASFVLAPLARESASLASSVQVQPKFQWHAV